MRIDERPPLEDARDVAAPSAERVSAAARRPLSATTYLLRNASRTVPLTAVIVMAVLLVSGIVSMMDSIPLSIRTIYGYMRYSLGITPRGDASMTPVIKRKIETSAPVPIDRIMVCRASAAEVRSIVGKWPFVVLGLEQGDMRYYLGRMSVTKLDGRLPLPGKPEALISEPVARNLGLKLGSALLSPDKAEYYSPNVVRIVGIARTEQWLMLTSVEYHRRYHFPPIDVLLVFARNLEDQARLDRWAVKQFKGQRAQLFVYEELDKNTNEMFDILYRILNVVIGMLVLVITVMMAMLMNIYQSQRVQEFGLLQALGYTKRALMTRVVRETAFVVLGGWILGLLCAFGLLNVVRAVLMDPRAFALDTVDRTAFLYTVPIPIAIMFAATYTVFLRFRRFDPVGVVERRLV